MSLVVAKKINGKIYIVSDTKLFLNDDELRNLKEGMLKTIFVNDKISISFAGDVEVAITAIEQTLPTDDIQTIIDRFKIYHLASKKETEFILTHFDETSVIHEIKDGEDKIVENAWVGDYKAFGQFQKFLHTKNEIKSDVAKQTIATLSGGEDNDGIHLYQAMAVTFMEKGVESVGGFPILISHTKESLRYADYTAMYTGVINTENQEEKDKNINLVSSAAQGGYTVNVFPCDYHGKRNFAIHIFQADLGIIYSQKKSILMEPEILNLSQFDFFDHCIDTFKCGLPGAYFGDLMTHYRQKALVYNSKGDSSSEIKYYDKLAEITGDDPILFYNRGLAYFKLGKVQESINDFKLVSGLNNLDIKAKAFLHLAEIALMTNDAVNAGFYFQEVLKLDPSKQDKIEEIQKKHIPMVTYTYIPKKDEKKS